MTFNVTHYGLYFGASDIEAARKNREKQDDLQVAWQWLFAPSGEVIVECEPQEKDAESQQVIKPTLDAGGQLLHDALRYRIMGDGEAGKAASQQLATYGLQDGETLFETITSALTAAHAFELLRDALPNNDSWLQQFAVFTDSLLQAEEIAGTVDTLWLMTLRIVSGIVLDDAERFQAGVDRYKTAIDTLVHPEGYIKSLSKNAEKLDKVTAFREMVLACAALTLAAEAATTAGENLWTYENRDVGLNTSITYLVYYYFYPDKWRWGNEDLTEDQTQAIFAELGAWIEISTRRVNPRGVEMLLEDRRPFWNPYMGGLTTLTHFKTERPKRFGIFG